MAYNPNKELKLYYSIGEVAKMFDVNESLLRYWEKEFPIISPKKAGGNVRQYRNCLLYTSVDRSHDTAVANVYQTDNASSQYNINNCFHDKYVFFLVYIRIAKIKQINLITHSSRNFLLRNYD